MIKEKKKIGFFLYYHFSRISKIKKQSQDQNDLFINDENT